MLKIVFLDAYTIDQNDIDWEGLYDLGTIKTFDYSTPEEGIHRGEDADIIIVNKHKVRQNELDHWSKCKLIVVAATGYNNIDLSAAKAHQITVCNVAGYSTNSVVQHVFASLLAVLNHSAYYFKETKEGRWTKTRDFCFLDHSIPTLSSMTMGIIGSGTIGRKVAEVAHAFDMHVMVYSKYPMSYDGPGNVATLDEIYEKADIISLHVPLNDATFHMVNKSALSKMKSNVILVNTSRGAVIHEEELYEHLLKHTATKAILDVLAQEPPPAVNKLHTLSNTFITPHIAWAAREARQQLLDGIVNNIKHYIEGNPINVVT